MLILRRLNFFESLINSKNPNGANILQNVGAIELILLHYNIHNQAQKYFNDLMQLKKNLRI